MAGAMANGSRSSDPLALCPRELNIVRFAEARASEMETMSVLISAQQLNQRLMQQLPIHMRRRSMSHNVKRFPRNLVGLARADMGSKVKIPKRPRRFHRPRDKSRYAEAYKKHGRDTDNAWLRTHIWHAKRFHMKRLWGVNLPYKSNEKCLRKVYRGMFRGTLVKDISYLKMIEVVGDQRTIVQTMARLTNPATGDDISGARFLSGRSRGLTHVYAPDAYPRDCVGPASFLWMPEGATSDVSPLINVQAHQRKLWIWTHPACAKDILAALQILSSHGCQIFEVGDTLAMFRIIGASCSQILREVFISPENSEMSDVNDVDVDISDVTRTLDKYGGNGNDVFSAMVKFPNLHRMPTSKRMEQSETKLTEPEPSPTLPNHDPLSPLFWSEEARETFNADIAEKIRGKRLKCDVDLCEDSESRIPLLLVHLPAPRGPSRATHGWEVIVPSEAAMPVWKSLTYHGARSLGIHEWQNVCTEAGYPVYPYSDPDTPAGKRSAIENSETRKQDYDRRPPGKRTNFIAMSISDPFSCPWGKLVYNWSGNTDSQSFFVIRDLSTLRKIQHAIDTCTSIGSDLPDAIVPITLTTVGRGNLDHNSMIAIPTKQDLRTHDEEGRDPEEKRNKRSKGQGAKPTLPSRCTIGYLHLAGYSLTHGRCDGQGFVSLKALDDLLERNRDSRVLVRATMTYQYRFARIAVMCERPSVNC